MAKRKRRHRGNIFNQVNMPKIKRNLFDLSNNRRSSFNMGELVPIMVQETLPGDTFTIKTSQLVRFAPMLAPIMHHCNVWTHYFYVPNRTVWDGFDDYIFGGETADTVPPVAPYFEIPYDQFSVGDLADHMGVPCGQPSITRDLKVSALPFAAYGKIFNEYFRDQVLMDPVPDTVSDGLNNDTAFENFVTGSCAVRSWERDYFTSCLSDTQKGPDATIPLGTRAEIEWEIPSPAVGSSLRNPSDGTAWTGPGLPTTPIATTGTSGATVFGDAASPTNQISIDVSASHYADLSTATAASIIDLRRAFKLQQWLEINNRAGSRYKEGLQNHFGVMSSDARLDRAEFLGGSKTAVTFSEVLQTSGTNGEPTPQGNMAGHGVSVGANRTIRYTCEEHGYIIGVMSILPKTGYFQGLPRHFSRFDRFDYFWKEFQHIGEQAVLNQELFITDTEADDLDTFGYQMRYVEYKHSPNTVHGKFKTDLDFWHLCRKFNSAPVLNDQFLFCNPDTRIFAVEAQGVEHVYAYVFNDVQAVRPMAYFGNPSM
jgi:hypothetical protein